MLYQLIKSKRKTIAISFDRGGNLVVKAPWFVSDREVERFVQSKEEWILATAKRLAKQKKKKEITLRNERLSEYFEEETTEEEMMNIIFELLETWKRKKGSAQNE